MTSTEVYDFSGLESCDFVHHNHIVSTGRQSRARQQDNPVPPIKVPGGQTTLITKSTRLSIVMGRCIGTGMTPQ